MLTSVARVLHRTHKKWRINKEMKGWRVRENFTPSSSDGDDDEEEESSDECLYHRKPRPFSTQGQCTRCPCRLHDHPRKEKDCPV